MWAEGIVLQREGGEKKITLVVKKVTLLFEVILEIWFGVLLKFSSFSYLLLGIPFFPVMSADVIPCSHWLRNKSLNGNSLDGSRYAKGNICPQRWHVSDHI